MWPLLVRVDLLFISSAVDVYRLLSRGIDCWTVALHGIIALCVYTHWMKWCYLQRCDPLSEAISSVVYSVTFLNWKNQSNTHIGPFQSLEPLTLWKMSVLNQQKPTCGGESHTTDQPNTSTQLKKHWISMMFELRCKYHISASEDHTMDEMYVMMFIEVECEYDVDKCSWARVRCRWSVEEDSLEINSSSRSSRPPIRRRAIERATEEAEEGRWETRLKRLICCQAQCLQTLIQFSVSHRLAVYLWQGGRIAVNVFTGGIMCVIDNRRESDGRLSTAFSQMTKKSNNTKCWVDLPSKLYVWEIMQLGA